MTDLLEALGEPVRGETRLDGLFATYLDQYERAWQAYPDALPCLEELYEYGFEPVLFSNGDDRQQRMKLERIGVRTYFSKVLTADSLGAAKPHRQAFDRAARALGRTGSELTYVGDDLDLDVLAARAAGWRAVHLDRSGTGHDRYRIRSLRELPALLRRRRAVGERSPR